MNQIWNSRDRYPSSNQYMRVEHWEIPQMFEFTVCKNNGTLGVPSVDVSSFFMIREDVEYLIQALQDYLQDYDAEDSERSEKDCMWEDRRWDPVRMQYSQR